MTSNPYFTLARELGEPYRQIINYVAWLDGDGQIETPSQREAMKYVSARTGLPLRIFRVWMNEQARRRGLPIRYDHLGNELTL